MAGSFMSKKNGAVGLLFAIATVVVLWLAWAYWGVGLMHRVALAGMGLAAGPSGLESYATAGQIGDLFGGVNALFAALACVGVFWAGWLQRQQLEDAQAAYAMERAASDLKEGETFFFQLLSIVKSVSDGIVFKSPYLMMRQMAVPDHADGIVHYALAEFSFGGSRGDLVGDEATFKAFEKALLPVLDKNSAALAAFFRTAFQLFVWLDSQGAMPSQKRVAYADIARAHVPSGLATLLGLFALQEAGTYFYDTVVRYGLLEHTIGSDQTRAAFSCRYPPAAFGVRD